MAGATTTNSIPLQGLNPSDAASGAANWARATPTKFNFTERLADVLTQLSHLSLWAAVAFTGFVQLAWFDRLATEYTDTEFDQTKLRKSTAIGRNQ